MFLLNGSFDYVTMSGIVELTSYIWGGPNSASVMVLLRDLPLMVHGLGW